MQACAPNLDVVIVARAVIGLASGASSVLVPLYLGEVAPPNLRGAIGTMVRTFLLLCVNAMKVPENSTDSFQTQFALVIGIFFVDLVGFLFANADQWRYMFAMTSVFGVLQLFMTPWLLESPRWLLSRNRDSPKARFIIKKLRGSRYDEEVETEVDHFIGAAATQDPDDTEFKKESRSVVKAMFADKNVRVLVVSTLVLQAAQQLCG